MGWISYSEDEVNRFHPEFEAIANKILSELNLQDEYRWEHHISSSGSSIVPDFVLIHNLTNRWCFVVEIKRSKAAVFSTRSQIQAKGYAEENSSLFRPEWPLYFVVSNLEMTMLFAQNGPNPPRFCRIKDMSFHSGDFNQIETEAHKGKFFEHFATIVQYCVNERRPKFESYWPQYTKAIVEYTSPIIYDSSIAYGTQTFNEDVTLYYAGSYSELDKTLLLLRCLLTEYIQGILRKYRHPHINRLSLRKGRIEDLANAIQILQSIDFSGIFEADVSGIYLAVKKVAGIKETLESFISKLVVEKVEENAKTREDSIELPDILVEEFFPPEVQEKRGKAQTDPDLAYLLASISLELRKPNGIVLDPGCGDGSLLSAAYDVLRDQGKTHVKISSQVQGIEIDPIAAKIAALRLALKEPHSISPKDECPTICRDMFESKGLIGNAQVVIMNPPFKRYEAQDASPIPDTIRQHYTERIIEDGGDIETNTGQANLFHYYVEYLVKTSSPGTVLGIILDNKWYHNKYATVLRKLMLEKCSILALVEYPHNMYFKNWSIATSMVFLKVGVAEREHSVKFVRTLNPYRSDFKAVAHAIANNGPFPSQWSAQNVLQSQLDATQSWKERFSIKLENEYRHPDWPTLDDLFEYSRRGSLAKEGGGIAVFEFPFDRTKYGPRRSIKPGDRSKFQTIKGEDLTKEENTRLRTIASRIDPEFRGLAIQNADQIDGYSISLECAQIDETLETPGMRLPYFSSRFYGNRRVRWDDEMNRVVEELIENDLVRHYISEIEESVGLGETVLSREELWNVLREPYAGELIIPRKLRVGHRVHINEFAYEIKGRQIRLSSNFFSYSNCLAIDETIALGRKESVELIVAFLLSSFGQLQFEIEAYNREGARSIEQHQLRQIKVFDPRWISRDNRIAILNAYRNLPYPIPTDRPPYLQNELVELDRLFAEEIVKILPELDASHLLDEVHQVLFEWIEIRRP